MLSQPHDAQATLTLLHAELPAETNAASPPASPPLVEASQGRYLDMGVIGEGGMGEVRRVRDLKLNRVVAMKCIRRALANREELVARFNQEILTTAQLQHPGIVPLYEVGSLQEGALYFTMREIRGRTLSEVIREVHQRQAGDPSVGGDWTFRRLVDAFRHVCETVAFAHSRGVLHRDLKPSNVMVGEFGEVLVLDWGVALLQEGLEEASSVSSPQEVLAEVTPGHPRPHTPPGKVVGTLSYMAPEQARAELERLGPRTDVYSLGAVLYELLSGHPPFEGLDAKQVLAQVRAGNRPSPWPDAWCDGAHGAGYFIPGIPYFDQAEVLWAICQKAMQATPEQRYANASQLSRALLDWLDGIKRQERARQHVEDVRDHPLRVQALRAEAARLRAQGQRDLAAARAWDPIDIKRGSWALEDQAEQLEREADQHELAYLQGLRAALVYDPGFLDAHARLASHFLSRHAEAEAQKDVRAAARLEALVREHDRRGQYAAYLEGYGALSIHTSPPGARVMLYRYERQERRAVPVPVQPLGVTPLQQVRLPQGSYLLELSHPGHHPVRYPVVIDRMGHWDGIPPGAAVGAAVWLPPLGTLGENDCYIPAGWFTCGGDSDAWNGLPRARVWLDGFVMQRFPVTNQDYLTFLNRLVAEGRASDALRLAPCEKAGGLGETGAPIYARDASGRFCLRADAEGDVWQPDWPIAMIDWHCAAQYAAALAQHTGLPWRLPSELEWEKAARGVDARYFPWGDFADPTWACMLESRPGRPVPAAVTAFPVDESPYGVRGLGGNMRDWCQDVFFPEGPRVMEGRAVSGLSPEHVAPPDPEQVFRTSRGGSWNGVLRAMRSCVRFRSLPGIRSAVLSMRLVRRVPACGQ